MKKKVSVWNDHYPSSNLADEEGKYHNLVLFFPLDTLRLGFKLFFRSLRDVFLSCSQSGVPRYLLRNDLYC